jgi:hypothetical protein
LANDKKFVVKNGLTTQNISFVDNHTSAIIRDVWQQLHQNIHMTKFLPLPNGKINKILNKYIKCSNGESEPDGK